MINAAIIGLGWWGNIVTKTLATSSIIKVVAAAEPNEHEARPFCRQNNRRYSSAFTDILRQDDIDAVILTTPNRLHEEQICQAAAAGKHVFCEKPLALSAESAIRIINTCSRNNIQLGIGHERRFEPPMRLAQKLLADGALGRLIQIEGNFSQNKFIGMDPNNWRLAKSEAGCGPMTATGIHLLNLAISLAGPVLEARALSSNRVTGFESDDSVSTLLTFADGVTATINAMLSTPFFSRFAVFGSNGWIEIHDHSHVESPTGWTVVRSDKDGGITTTQVPASTPVKDNLEAFASAIATGRDSYPISLQDMADTCAALEAVQKSAETLGLGVIPATMHLEARLES